MTAHAYNHSNIITTTIIIIIITKKISELRWCSNNNMATTILILVENFFYHLTKFWPYLGFAHKTLHASRKGLYIIILKVSSP